jgi:hypothetical protein
VDGTSRHHLQKAIGENGEYQIQIATYLKELNRQTRFKGIPIGMSVACLT